VIRNHLKIKNVVKQAVLQYAAKKWTGGDSELEFGNESIDDYIRRKAAASWLD